MAGKLLFREARAGGFIAPSAALATLPDVSIYADGTVIIPGSAPITGSTPAVPAIVVDHVSPAGLNTIMAAARATGLADPTATFDGGPSPDAGVTLITIDLGGPARHLRIMSLGDATRDVGLDPKVVAGRVKVRAFLASLSDLGKLLWAEVIAGPSPYLPTSIRLIVSPGQPAGGSGAAAAWPLAAPLATFGTEIVATNARQALGMVSAAAGLNGGTARCGVVTGADLVTLTPLLATATTSTAWTSGGQPYTIAVRPLLPDETGCPGA